MLYLRTNRDEYGTHLINVQTGVFFRFCKNPISEIGNQHNFECRFYPGHTDEDGGSLYVIIERYETEESMNEDIDVLHRELTQMTSGGLVTTT